MLAFWIVATLMLVVAVAIVLIPLLRHRPLAGPTSVEANLEVLRGQRRELEADVAAGLLPAQARDEALAELVERARSDLEPETAAPAGSAHPPWALVSVIAVVIPAVALGLYLAVGTPAATGGVPSAGAEAPVHNAQMNDMVNALAKKVRERPDDAEGWSLLARSMGSMGRFQESAEAYEHLAKLAPGDAQVLADWADALGMAQGRNLQGRPSQIVNQALAADPANPKALALAGTIALDAGDYPAAQKHWQALAAQVPPGSPDAEQVASILEEVRQRAAAAGKPLPASAPPKALAQAAPAKPVANVAAAAAPAPAMPAPKAAAAAGKDVSGSVALSPAMASQVAGNETVFIFARAENGPRVPLAVIRTNAKELPMKFALDDSQAMAPGMTISSVEALRVEARISKSGNPMAQPGDLVGTSGPVKPGTRDVKVVVDKVVP